MTQNENAEARWTGRDLLDTNGHKIGVIEEVRSGDPGGQLTWLIVDSGLIGAKKRLIPANDVRAAGERLSVPYSKERIDSAPEPESGAALTDADQGRLCRYYGLVHPGATAQPAEGCDEMPDVRPAG